MQKCTLCHLNKPLSEFRKQSDKKDGHQSACKDCAKVKDKEYSDKEKNKFRARIYRKTHKKHISELRRNRYLKTLEKHKDQQLKRAFGISLVDYNKMLEKQHGKCKICLKPEINRQLSVDHDHKTGKVRGLLCNHCNRGLGSFYDNTEMLKAAIKYLST